MFFRGGGDFRGGVANRNATRQSSVIPLFNLYHQELNS